MLDETFLSRVYQLINEAGKIELKYQHFATSNELRDLGKYHPGLLTGQKNDNQEFYDLMHICSLPPMDVFFCQNDSIQTWINPLELTDLDINTDLQKIQRTE